MCSKFLSRSRKKKRKEKGYEWQTNLMFYRWVNFTREKEIIELFNGQEIWTRRFNDLLQIMLRTRRIATPWFLHQSCHLSGADSLLPLRLHKKSPQSIGTDCGPPATSHPVSISLKSPAHIIWRLYLADLELTREAKTIVCWDRHWREELLSMAIDRSMQVRVVRLIWWIVGLTFEVKMWALSLCGPPLCSLYL